MEPIIQTDNISAEKTVIKKAGKARDLEIESKSAFAVAKLAASHQTIHQKSVAI